MIVIVTIHGIGFQQAPPDPKSPQGTTAASVPGYADTLHTSLKTALPPGCLGDDPERSAGPVYVQSTWPPAGNQTEAGLERLGTWKGSEVDPNGKDLTAKPTSLAHVALVYSHLQESREDPTALLGMGILGAASIGSYATVRGVLGMAFHDIEALHQQKPGAPSPSLTVRPEAQKHVSRLSRLFRRHQPQTASQDTPAGVFRQVEDDIAAYVIRNEHRERVRAFVRDAVCRIIARKDVSGVVINGHSNGCVMGFDMLTALSPPYASKVRGFVTSGCPLRKYVDFLDWGTDARSFADVTAPWFNFYDELDPVADPMAPDVTWKRPGKTGKPPGGPGLFVVYDQTTGKARDIAVEDRISNNVAAAVGGGLPAHNYWDNKDGFITPVSQEMLAPMCRPSS